MSAFQLIFSSIIIKTISAATFKWQSATSFASGDWSGLSYSQQNLSTFLCFYLQKQSDLTCSRKASGSITYSSNSSRKAAVAAPSSSVEIREIDDTVNRDIEDVTLCHIHCSTRSAPPDELNGASLISTRLSVHVRLSSYPEKKKAAAWWLSSSWDSLWHHILRALGLILIKRLNTSRAKY